MLLPPTLFHLGLTVTVPARRPGLVLAVVLLAAFAINLDTTIVNVALPALSEQLHASTSDLQWVVDGYNLAFAALVLAGGTLGDRWGRRSALATGLALFAAASAVAALAGGPGALVALRVVMGAAAALIFPTTLSIIRSTFPDRGARARAVGAWGAVTGLGVAVGPVAGGALLARWSWTSVFVALVPVALLALAGTWLVVPAGRPAAAGRLDVRGLVVSAVALTSLVFSVIEAPGVGWTSTRTLGGLALAAAAFAALVVVETRVDEPMLDVRLFADLRFTAASGAVTVAFFALFGFIFLITQYMQVLRDWSALSTGLRILPVAAAIAVTSATGTLLAVRVGNKAVVASGLFLLVLAFSWISLASATLPYGVIAAQMVVLGSGLGLTTAPATEAILGVVRPEQAGVGSAVNDATREVGGTLGVAVVGSVFASLYRASLDGLPLPPAVTDAARSSYAASRQVAAGLPEQAQRLLLEAADRGFLDGLHAGCRVAAGVCLAGAVAVLALLPSRPPVAAPETGGLPAVERVPA